MTLIELLVSVIVIGSIATVLAAALTVTFRQQGDTQGRLDVARWGQSLAMWLPTDIASADTSTPAGVNVDPTIAPCASAECTFGSNALQLKWNDGTGETTVSYRYGPAGDGTSFILTRVECKGGACTSRVVLRDLSGPVDDDGNPVPWYPGNEVPNEVIDVTVPIAVLSSDPLDTDNDSTAQRVIVNVNGAPGVDGTNRSASVSFTAGGSSFDTIDPTTYEKPRFLQANSGCGGPVTLIVDESASLSSTDMDNVKLGVRSFINAFEGTPTQLQIVTFHTQSRTLGAGSSWNKFFDLAEPADVLALMGPTGNSGLVGTIAIGTGTGQGGTNWEDALHRTFYSKNGQTYKNLGDPNAPASELVVFFTDGVPTFDRQHAKSDTSSVGPPSIPSQFTYDTANTPGKGYGNDYTPRGWYRADYIVEPFRNVEGFNFIGVGVGPAFNLNTRVYRNGWPGPTSTPNPIPNAVFLGDLIRDGNPDRYGEAGQSGDAVTRTYHPVDGWVDVASADLLVTSDFTQFGSALTAIALVDCGGTLTVQTRDQAGDPADAKITYQVDFNDSVKTVTTSRIAKAGTFDIPLSGVASAEVELIPQPFDSTGKTAQGWTCRAGGVDLPATDYHLIESGNPAAGIAVTVRASAAVSCTLRVSP